MENLSELRIGLCGVAAISYYVLIPAVGPRPRPSLRPNGAIKEAHSGLAGRLAGLASEGLKCAGWRMGASECYAKR